jgi:hypothetical protein
MLNSLDRIWQISMLFCISVLVEIINNGPSIRLTGLTVLIVPLPPPLLPRNLIEVNETKLPSIVSTKENQYNDFRYRAFHLDRRMCV